VKLSIEQLELGGRRAFVRADLNAPLEHGAVSDDTRLTAVLPTLRLALERGAAVVLASHLGRPKGGPDPTYSLRPVAERLTALLEQPVPLAPDCVGEAVERMAHELKPGQVLLLENLRFHREEEAWPPWPTCTSTMPSRPPIEPTRPSLRSPITCGRPPPGC
jgi:phosphoglycerate kinase